MVPSIYSQALPQANLPHLPSQLSNVTVDKALDTVALKFGGVIIYGFCKARKLYSIQYVEPGNLTLQTH